MNEFNKTELLEKTTEYMNYIAQHKETLRRHGWNCVMP